MTLDTLVPLLQSDPKVCCIDITGHTDSSGPASYNLNLSQRRAQAVRSYLINKGIAATRLMAHGDGASHPIASNATKEGRQRNRRTEILVRYTASDGG
jgi:OOP family OmpA-OmpF porin